MELRVTTLIEEYDMFDFSHSEFEHEGAPGTAGRDTWTAACECPIRLVTPQNEAEIADWIRDFGAWDDDDVSEMCRDGTLNALLIQFIAGDYREHWEDLDDGAEPNFETLGSLWRDPETGKWYFYVGS